eukprot:jgi/Chlat1/4076/Chrsp26S04005
MAREVKVAACQMSCSWDIDANLAKAERLVRSAHEQGAQIILLQELFETPYFCQEQKPEHFALAKEVHDNPFLDRMSALAKELGVVLPISFFERANNAHYNSLVVMDADGTRSDPYHKSHIPDGPGYQEKFYFNPGDTGFKAFKTRFATIGVAICWDQWFPEGARSMCLQGAEILFYPTAIGSEPQDPTLNSRSHWERVMQGHAASNVVPLVTSNRVGTETFEASHITFYGSSFIAGPTGEKVQQLGEKEEGVAVASFDLDAIRTMRAGWGLFRDRRPDLYTPLLTLDGVHRHPGAC